MIKEIVVKAYNYAKENHEGQKRKYSELDYITHPKAVARIIEDLTKKDYLVAVALLHDVIEDTNATYLDIVGKFGQRIATLVMELTETPEKRKDRKKVDYLIEAMAKMSEDALTVKLADRYHNIKYLGVDIVGKDHKDFIKYYLDQTTEIMREIDDLLTFTHVQQILYDRIINTIDYIEVKHLGVK
jgi:(p)ppGpp synthase/HD superfamily hydrolase